MKHLGNIKSINGAEIPWVDCIIGGSPCFPAGTLILTTSGFVPIEDLSVGDLVLTHMGRWRKVTEIGNSISETVILSGNFYGLECTPNHPIFTADDCKIYGNENGKRFVKRILSDNKYFVEAQDMEKKLWAVPRHVDYLDIPKSNIEIRKYTTSLNDMPEINKDLFYFVGRWLGDGYLRSNQRQDRAQGQTWNQIII